MRLADGTLWPIPVTLPVPPGATVSLDGEFALTGAKGEILAVLTVRELCPWNRETEARAIFGLVVESASWGPALAAGELRVLDLPARFDFTRHRLEPAAARARLAALGNPRVVAFQTRNPLRRSHEELLRRAQEQLGATLLLHPSVGATRPGDVDHVTRVRTCEAVVSRHLDPSRSLLALLPLAMRMAGPRETLWHALIRRNHGASHFIVGRDHAGPGPRSDGKPFFGPFEAQELVERHRRVLEARMFALSRRGPAGSETVVLAGDELPLNSFPLPHPDEDAGSLVFGNAEGAAFAWRAAPWPGQLASQW